MGWVTLSIAIASFVVSVFSLANWALFRGRLIQTSILLGDSLLSVKNGIEKIDLAIPTQRLQTEERQRLQNTLLTVRNQLERSLRRIMLFGREKEESRNTLQWFCENGIPDDIIYIKYALKFRCIPGRQNRLLAKSIILKLEQQSEI